MTARNNKVFNMNQAHPKFVDTINEVMNLRSINERMEKENEILKSELKAVVEHYESYDPCLPSVITYLFKNKTRLKRIARFGIGR